MVVEVVKPVPGVPLAKPVPPVVQGVPLAKPVPHVLTDEQRRAIFARDVSVALSAGAGCGKTFVLTERFISHLEPNSPNPARLGQLVAITFTERAAREMRNRIRAACHDRLIECPEQEVGYWLTLLRELDSARISTIHSFCGSLLRAHAVEAGLDPRFSVMDQSQADTLLTELIHDELRNRLGDQEEEVIDLVVQYGLGDLGEMIAQLLRQRQEIDWASWRTVTAEMLTAKWQDYFQREALPRMMQSIVSSPAAKIVLDIAREKPSNNPVMRERMAFLLDILPKLAENPSGATGCLSASAMCDTMQQLREATMLKGAGTKKDWPSDELYNKYKDAAVALRDTIDGLKNQISFDPNAARQAAETGLRLLSLADSVGQAYNAEKQNRNTLDFNDLLIHAKNLLVGEKRKNLRQRWAANLRLLLVDEFQDTDPLQVELVKALCDNEVTRGKLFFVGDFKQSIYRFRGADPRVFHNLRDEIPPEGRLPLSLNFRSQPAVLDFVNTLFCQEFLNYEPLRAHRPQIGPTPAVEFLWASEELTPSPGVATPGLNDIVDETSDDEKPTERRRRREADWIARRIRFMLDSGEKLVWDEEGDCTDFRVNENGTVPFRPSTRAVQPGDVALLFRALTEVEYYEAALRRYGIDYYLVGGHAFYAQQEIYDLLNLLRALESPCDQISLLGVLRSPFFNLFDETIFWLARVPDGLNSGLYSDTLPAQISKDQIPRVKFAAKTLRELRAMKDRVPIALLIGEAIDRTGYDAVLLAEFLGERKLANLYKIVEQARSFDQSGMSVLSDFITQLSEFVATQPDEPLAATQSETMNVVRLMTIHQAKGLEFPVVVVPDMARPHRGPTARVAFTSELGPMVKDDETAVGHHLYSQVEKEEAKDEIARLLYVAATRAADYLILSSGVDKSAKTKGTWMELLGRRFDLQTGKSLQNELQVKVTTTKPPVQSEPSDSAGRPNLIKLLEQAGKKAKKGEGRLPNYLAPIAPDQAAQRQYSFSRLSGALHGDCPYFRASENGTVPLSLFDMEEFTEPSVDPLGLGTLVHAVMEEIDFTSPGDFEAIIRRHAATIAGGQTFMSAGSESNLPLTSEIDLTAAIDMIGRFIKSPRAAQIAAAAEIHRELEFLLAWPPDSPQPGGRYLQGFIDCLYRDQAGGWHIIDYKTNNITAKQLKQEAAKYEMQMLLYALAAEKILKSPPVELTLCFLRPGLEYQFSWNEKTKRRVIDMVNEALP
jgi:ATP-dependent helicase/nuclease subunit A